MNREVGMSDQVMYQVSTLQALAMGYSRSVITVEELLKHGDIGLGTFEDVNGEMIMLDGCCCRATDDGTVVMAEPDRGVPFCAVTFYSDDNADPIGEMSDIDQLKQLLDIRIDEDFSLNSMHVARIDGFFRKICARSESAYRSHHVSLKDILGNTQTEFYFSDIRGTLVCVHFPDYMDGINAPGWHMHFISEDRKYGGHVFDMVLEKGTMNINKISQIHIQLPNALDFDTYSLKEASQDEIKEVEQGK